MTLPRSPTGVAYWPDASTHESVPPPGRHGLLVRAALFLALFALMQSLYAGARGTWVERLVIDHMTVRTAVALIDAFDPAVGVEAVGSRLRAPGGGINVLNGCEGIDVVFLLASALLVGPLSWRHRLTGLLIGGSLVFVLNQARVLALFYAFRSDKALFDLLHGIVAPLLLVVATGAFFAVWLARHGKAAASP